MGPPLAALTEMELLTAYASCCLLEKFNKMNACYLFLLELANLQDGALLL